MSRTFILIWFLHVHFNSAMSGSAEFRSLEACEAVKKQIIETNVTHKWDVLLCVPKE